MPALVAEISLTLYRRRPSSDGEEYQRSHVTECPSGILGVAYAAYGQAHIILTQYHCQLSI